MHTRLEDEGYTREGAAQALGDSCHSVRIAVQDSLVAANIGAGQVGLQDLGPCGGHVHVVRGGVTVAAVGMCKWVKRGCKCGCMAVHCLDVSVLLA
jgi:hypothetical protein